MGCGGDDNDEPEMINPTVAVHAVYSVDVADYVNFYDVTATYIDESGSEKSVSVTEGKPLSIGISIPADKAPGKLTVKVEGKVKKTLPSIDSGMTYKFSTYRGISVKYVKKDNTSVAGPTESTSVDASYTGNLVSAYLEKHPDFSFESSVDVTI